MTKYLTVVFCLLGLGDVAAQTAAPPPPEPDDIAAQANKNFQAIYQAWQKEHDHAKRRELAEQVTQAAAPAMLSDDGSGEENIAAIIPITDEVVRDGAPVREIKLSTAPQTIALAPLATLKDAQVGANLGYITTPVFRRISRQDIEAWTPREGWLFNSRGKILADVHVPRRNGQGAEWFGAFLPDGTWITTDLWESDKQINCFSPSGKWKWEIRGSSIVSVLPKPSPYGDEWNPPLIDWARADKTGRHWLVSVGSNGDAGFTLIDEERRLHPLPYDTKLWQLVYPRAMGVRGGISRNIDSDDATTSLDYECPEHGMFCAWPNYTLSHAQHQTDWTKSIYYGSPQFGFWPDSHRSYVEIYPRSENRKADGDETWFFTADGKYEGQIAGYVFADAANGRDLLVHDRTNRVLQLAPGQDGVTISGARTFTWPDGSAAEPLALYDDLKIGFFLRVPGTSAPHQSSSDRPGDVVLAKWP